VAAWEQLRAVFDASPAAVVLIAPDDTVSYLNEPAARAFAPARRGSPLAELTAREPSGRLARAVAGATPRGGAVEVTVGGCTLQVGVTDLGGEAGWPAVALVAVPAPAPALDVARAQVQASLDRERRTSDRVAHLQRAVNSLAGALTEERVLQIVVGTGRLLGASSSAVGFIEQQDGREVLRFPHFAGHLTPLPPTVGDLDLDLATPSCLAARTAEPYFFSSPEEVRTLLDSDTTRHFLANTEERSWAMLPLVVHGRALGVLRCGWADARSFPEDERAALLLLAGQCAAAVDRARLFARQRGAAAALAYSELRYRTLTESVALDVFTADVTGAFISEMPHWSELTGRAGSTAGLAWLQDVHPAERAAVSAAWMAAVRGETPYEMELRIRAADGSHRAIRMRAVPVRDDSGGPSSPGTGTVREWIGTSEDVTEARATARRAVALQRVTAALAGALTVDQVVAVTTAVARDTLGADRADVVLLDDTGSGLPGLPGLPELPEGLAAPGAEPLPDLGAARAAIDRQEPVFSAGTEPGAELGPGPGLDRVALPLNTTGAAFGALLLRFESPQDFPPAQRDFLLALAGQCAQALERASLFAREQSTAQILQRALLPERLPSLDGLAVAARYQAAGGSDVGGDWYDVLGLPSGGAAIVLGDVVGRGVRAASLMGQVRTGVRAYVAQDPRPAHVLSGLDRLFTTFGSDELVTIFYGVIAPDGTMTYAIAGHLPPFLVRSDGRVELLSGPASPPLGIDRADRPVGRVLLEPGTLLCVYSDGVVEHRTRSIDEGMAALSRLLVHLRVADGDELDLEAAADRVLAELVTGESAADDASLLLVRTGRPPRRAHPSTRSGSLALPAERGSGQRGRAFVREQCRQWSVRTGVDTAELLAGELLANAIVHAGTPLELRLELRAATLRVAVADRDPRRPTRQACSETSIGGRGLALVQALADRWGVDPAELGTGKHVWFELPVEAQPSGGAARVGTASA
jgi:PAS domain S-box-containing protein